MTGQVLNRFLYCSARKADLGLVDPKTMGQELSSSLESDDEVQLIEDKPAKTNTKGGAKGNTNPQTRLRDYASSRNSADSNTSSRLSPYLASGVISIRTVLNKVKKLLGNKLESGRDSGPGTWVMECAWRDFYNHVSIFIRRQVGSVAVLKYCSTVKVLAAFPRVSMGRPFQEKFAEVQWEVDEDKFNAWKDGRTGFPVVDAAMRQCKYMGWMHSRLTDCAVMFKTGTNINLDSVLDRPRMICASFLVSGYGMLVQIPHLISNDHILVK